MKRILLAVPQLTGGGAERVVSVWANELTEKGFDVSIVLFFRNKDEYYTNENVRIVSLVESLEEYFKLSSYKKFVGLRRILLEIRPTHIISFLPSMQVWMMLTSIGLHSKRIETIRVNPWKVNVPGLINKIMWKMCYHTSRNIIIQASGQKEFFSKIDQKKTVLIPNPISDKYLRPTDRIVTVSPRRFIAVGRIDKQKNYPMMIKAFSKVLNDNAELQLYIFGDGEEAYVYSLNKMIHSLNISNNVKIMGRTASIEKEYLASDIFLMSSDFEGLPNALIEAMASELVCISTDCKTGPIDLIENKKNGFLVQVGNVEQMRDRIEYALDMTVEERHAMGKSARDKVLDYCSKSNSLEKLCKILS